MTTWEEEYRTAREGEGDLVVDHVASLEAKLKASDRKLVKRKRWEVFWVVMGVLALIGYEILHYKYNWLEAFPYPCKSALVRK